MTHPTESASPHPIQPDQEWANAWSHGLSAGVWILVGGGLIQRAWTLEPSLILDRSSVWDQAGNDVTAQAMPTGLFWSVTAYVLSAIAVFACSTLSHVFLRPPWLERFRAADQACIYLMIVGTYTPIAHAFAAAAFWWPLMIGMWAAAIAGFFAKLVLNHRIDSISVVSYLVLGWVPAAALITRVPLGLAMTMLMGGLLYSGGVWFLLHDQRRRYFHVIWHLLVLAASLVHAGGIAWYVLR